MIKRLWIILFAVLSISLAQLFQTQIFADEQSRISSARKVYLQTSDSIYTIYGIEPSDKDKGVALGSAVAIDKNILATNCHVALAGSMLVVYINDKPIRGQLYYYDQHDDLCLVKVPGTTFNPIKIRASITVNIGEEVYAIGNPKGYEKTISKGIISNKYKFKNGAILQTDAAISPGSSGGGLFDENGNLIGITFLKEEGKGSEGLGFAIPTELILTALEQENPISEKQTTTSYQSTSQQNQVSSAPLIQTETESLPNIKTNQTDSISRVGYFGKSEIGLLKLNEKCFIAIPGRYQNQPKSLAIWFPTIPDALFIFSRITNADDAIRFMREDQDKVDLMPSKSFIFLDNKLYNLQIFTKNNTKYPAYIFTDTKDLTKRLVDGDDFLGQFHGYNENSTMTTITFKLDGFTEALGAYNKFCAH